MITLWKKSALAEIISQRKYWYASKSQNTGYYLKSVILQGRLEKVEWSNDNR
jgi:hypothetical protein